MNINRSLKLLSIADCYYLYLLAICGFQVRYFGVIHWTTQVLIYSFEEYCYPDSSCAMDWNRWKHEGTISRAYGEWGRAPDFSVFKYHKYIFKYPQHLDVIMSKGNFVVSLFLLSFFFNQCLLVIWKPNPPRLNAGATSGSHPWQPLERSGLSRESPVWPIRWSG